MVSRLARLAVLFGALTVSLSITDEAAAGSSAARRLARHSLTGHSQWHSQPSAREHFLTDTAHALNSVTRSVRVAGRTAARQQEAERDHTTPPDASAFSLAFGISAGLYIVYRKLRSFVSFL
jgi:hypothetical protein